MYIAGKLRFSTIVREIDCETKVAESGERLAEKEAKSETYEGRDETEGARLFCQK